MPATDTPETLPYFDTLPAHQLDAPTDKVADLLSEVLPIMRTERYASLVPIALGRTLYPSPRNAARLLTLLAISIGQYVAAEHTSPLFVPGQSADPAMLTAARMIACAANDDAPTCAALAVAAVGDMDGEGQAEDNASSVISVLMSIAHQIIAHSEGS